jgi:hypothetical protein
LPRFYDFENEAKIFPEVDHRVRFSIVSMTGGEIVKEVRLSFLNRHIVDAVQTRFELGAAEVVLLNPNTGTLPIFRTRRDADITLACYRRHPVLIRDCDRQGNPWGLRFSQGLFNMASDSEKFLSAEELVAVGAEFDGWSWSRGDQRWLPLYEAKMLSHWNHRFSTYADATQAQLNVGSLPGWRPCNSTIRPSKRCPATGSPRPMSTKPCPPTGTGTGSSDGATSPERATCAHSSPVSCRAVQ